MPVRIPPSPFGTRAVSAVLALVVLLSVAGCGSGTANEAKSPLQKAFAGSTAEDLDAVDASIDEYQVFMARKSDYVDAMNDEDFAAARVAIDAMTVALGKAEDRLLDVDNSAMRRANQDNLAAVAALAVTMERLLGAYEDGSAEDPQLRKQLESRLLDAAANVQTVERKYAARMLENASPRERDALRKQFRELTGGPESDKNPVQKAFADSTPLDIALLGEVINPLLRQYDVFLAKTADDDVRGARRAIARASTGFAKTKRRIVEVGSPSLRATVRTYATRLMAVLEAADPLLAYYEEQDAPADARLEDRLQRRFDQAVERAAAADREFMNDVLDRVPPEDRERVRKEYRSIAKARMKLLGE